MGFVSSVSASTRRRCRRRSMPSSKGDDARGASTITMQLARNLFLPPSRTILRKVAELWLTPQLAVLWPKKRVIEVYLNVVEFGPGLYGAEAASRAYFPQKRRATQRRRGSAPGSDPAGAAQLVGRSSRTLCARTCEPAAPARDATLGSLLGLSGLERFQECEQQARDLVRLFLLHPMAAPSSSSTKRMSVQTLVCIFSNAPGVCQTPQSAAPPMKQLGTSMVRPAKTSRSAFQGPVRQRYPIEPALESGRGYRSRRRRRVRRLAAMRMRRSRPQSAFRARPSPPWPSARSMM